MKKFVVLYFAPKEAMEKMKDKSPEDMKKGMDLWMQWAQKCGDHLVDLGTPLCNGSKITPAGSSPSDKNVAGYSILQAEDLNAAKALLVDHPHLGWDAGCEIEIHECSPLPA